MDKISTKKRREILDAAIKLFFEKGFDRTTVDEIASKANVGKGTIYLYFENKEHIFLAIIDEAITELYHLFERITVQKNFLDQLKELIFAHFKYVEEHRELYGIFMKERLGMRLWDEDNLRSRFMGIHQKFHQSITELMQRGIDQGIIRPIDPAYLGMAFSGMVSHFAFYWLFTNDSQPLTQFTKTIFTLFLKGVENPNNQNVPGGVSHAS